MARPLKICHDRILPQDLFKPRRSEPSPRGASFPRRAVFELRKRWVTGSTLRVHFLEGTAEQKAIARKEGLLWTRFANLDLDFTGGPDADIRIAFDPSDGAWSWVGTDATRIPQGQPTMNLGFLDGGTATHEFGHAIGLGHEHQNPKGGIQWNEDVVIRSLRGPPNYWTDDQIRQNVLDKYRFDQVIGTDFDPDSVMLYAFPGTWVKSGQGTKANAVMSALDKEFIASARAYPGRAEPAPEAPAEPVTLKVDASKTTRGSIGAAGEEDLYQFTVKKPGRHVVRTGGETDTVMKLFGPDSQTRLVAEDDDGGVSSNARIAVDLAPGVYLVQVRHYNKDARSGDYTVSVSG